MSWTEATTTATTWSTIDMATQINGRVLYSGMPLGMLLAITYATDYTIGWPPTDTTTTIWTATT